MSKKKQETKKIDPLQYFENIKKAKNKTTDKWLKDLYTTSEVLLQKAFAVGQEKQIEKLIFTIEVLKKEHKLLEKGFDTFVYRDDVLYFISDVSDKVVKVIELEKYAREIPDEIAEQIIELKKEKLFDQYFIIFTDYTGETEREVEAERRRKDPILFGCFKKGTDLVHDRMYYIGDWEDEYCDLTLSKMISKMAKEGKEINHKVGIKKASVEEIKEYMKNLKQPNNNASSSFKITKKPNIFKKIKLWFKK